MNKSELQTLVRLANKPIRHRNRPKPPTPKEAVLASFRGGPEPTKTGNALSVQEILARVKP